MRELLPPEEAIKVPHCILGLGVDLRNNNFYGSLSSPKRPFILMEFNNSFKAFRWLQKYPEKRMPYAIICSLQFLKNDAFKVLEGVRMSTQLREIPLIVLCPNDDEPNVADLLKYGVDDCFKLPLDWNFIERRIEFLKTHKKNLLQFSAEESDWIELELPPSKRIFDLILSSFFILVFSPLLLLIALAIKLESKGSVIYRSQRVGKGYQVFNFLKFRSMYKDSDKRLSNLKHLNQYYTEEDNCFVKIKNDPRVTKIGRWLRKTSLDELPQLFNVLFGDMSIVGNRPLPLYEAELLTKDEWAQRFLAPAGITGLWQVTKRGKNDMSTRERVNLDISYAENYSFWFDLKLLYKTLPAMMQEEDV